MDARIQKIEAFVAAARLGSLTRAARQLGCTQSTASRMVSSLEDEWGVRLFDRRGPLLSLTVEGTLLLPDARAVCEASSGLERSIRGLCDVEMGTVGIAAPSSIMSRRLAGPLVRFVTEHPSVEINLFECTYQEAEQMLRDGRADFSFVTAQVEGPGLVSAPFDRDEIVVVTPMGHFAQDVGPIPVQRLLNERFIADTETAPVLQRELTSPFIRCTTSDITVILTLVEAGLGISLLPSLSLDRLSHHVEVHHLEVPAHRTVYLAHRRERELSPAATSFLGYLDRKKR